MLHNMQFRFYLVALGVLALICLDVFATGAPGASLAVLPVAGIAPLNGWRQVGAAHWMEPAAHVFEANAAGELVHTTNGALRAVIPPEGWADYLNQWPEAEAIIAALSRPPAPADAGPETAPGATNGTPDGAQAGQGAENPPAG